MAAEWRNPKYDIKKDYGVVFDQALCLSLALLTLIFMTNRTFVIKDDIEIAGPEIILVEDIPATEQLKIPSPPQRPQIPIPTESEEIPEDVTIVDTDLNLDVPLMPTPPMPGGSGGSGPGTSTPIHRAWEEPPEVVRMVVPEYPREAKAAGIEGSVMLQIIVDERGYVISASVIAADPPGIFEDAAIQAIMKWRFRPAKFRGKPIKVQTNQTVEFTLSNNRRKPPSS